MIYPACTHRTQKNPAKQQPCAKDKPSSSCPTQTTPTNSANKSSPTNNTALSNLLLTSGSKPSNSINLQSNSINNLLKNSPNINSNYKRNSSQANSQASKIPMKTAVQLLQQQQHNIHQQQQQRKSIANNNFMITGSSVSPTNSASANNVSHFKLNSNNLMRSPETVAHSSSPTPMANKVNPALRSPLIALVSLQFADLLSAFSP